MTSPADLNLLRSFRALIEEKGVSAAARRLDLSQPSLSAALARLRVLFDDELLVRSGNGMMPTARALELLPEIAAALDRLDAVVGRAVPFDPKTSTRTFRLGVSDYASCVVVPRLTAWLAREAPEVNLRTIGYEKDSAGELLDAGVVDAAIGTFHEPPKRSLVRPLFEETFIGVARPGHPAVSEGALDLTTFAALPQLLVTLRRDATGRVDEILDKMSLRRRVALTVPHMLAVPSIVSTTDLICALARRVASPYIERGELLAFDLPIENPPWTVSLLWAATIRQDQSNGWFRSLIERCCEHLD